MNTEKLLAEADRWTKDYLARTELGSAEELQMLSTAYAGLFLTAAAAKPTEELAKAHSQIADCFAKLEEPKWESRHRELAAAYLRQ